MGLLQPAGSAPCFCRHFPSPTDVQNPNLRSALGFCGNPFFIFFKCAFVEKGKLKATHYYFSSKLSISWLLPGLGEQQSRSS